MSVRASKYFVTPPSASKGLDILRGRLPWELQYLRLQASLFLSMHQHSSEAVARQLPPRVTEPAPSSMRLRRIVVPSRCVLLGNADGAAWRLFPEADACGSVTSAGDCQPKAGISRCFVE